MRKTTLPVGMLLAMVPAIVLALTAVTLAQQPVSLIDAEKPAGGWEFGNGPEFPGPGRSSHWPPSVFTTGRSCS